MQNAKKALDLYQQQVAGVAAGFGTPCGVQPAGQRHAQHVAQVVALATDQGVQAITDDGQDLIMLGPEDLREWVRSHVADAAEAYW